MSAAELDLTIAVGDSDLNRALVQGDVGVRGARSRCLTMPSPQRHWRMLRHQEFDVAEVSLGAYLSSVDRRPGELVAVPAFPHRRFRHSFLFVAHDSPVTDPAELAGGRIGLRTWTNTAGVWARGILQEQYGVDLAEVQWVIQDADTAGTENLPPGFRIDAVPAGGSVVDLAARGELDALIYPETPDTLGEPGGLRRLLPDPQAAEVDYFRRTGIFPIMHAVVLSGELARRHPWLPSEVLEAFRASKDRALTAIANPRTVCLAWARDAYEHQVALMGPDPFGYDAATSRPTVEALVRHAADQGVIGRPLAVEELFHPSTVDEPPRYVRR